MHFILFKYFGTYVVIVVCYISYINFTLNIFIVIKLKHIVTGQILSISGLCINGIIRLSLETMILLSQRSEINQHK